MDTLEYQEAVIRLFQSGKATMQMWNAVGYAVLLLSESDSDYQEREGIDSIDYAVETFTLPEPRDRWFVLGPSPFYTLVPDTRKGEL